MKQLQGGVLARGLIVVSAIVLAALVFLGAVTVQKISRELGAVRMDLAQLEQALPASGEASLLLLKEPAQWDAFQDQVASLDADLAALQKSLGPLVPLCRYLGWLPEIGADVRAAPYLLDMARHTTDAAVALVEGVRPLSSLLATAGPGLSDVMPDLLDGLEKARPQLQAAQGALSQASLARSEIDAGRLSRRTRSLLDRFDRYEPMLGPGLAALQLLPSLLGSEGPRTFLVLAENSHELRATGGFISGVGRVQLEAGQLADIAFQDSYSVDNLEQPHALPPAPLRQHMRAGMLVLRDANWWPDFPTSARTVSSIYDQDQGIAVDGVVAADLTTLRLLVDALGPIVVPGYDQPVNSDNLQEVLMASWEAPRLAAPGKDESDWWSHRKDFAAELMSALLQRILGQATPGEWLNLVKALGQALQERHLMIYANDPQIQATLRALRWDGAIQSNPGDYLMIVDSNVGFNKVGPNIEQTADYEVTLESSGSAEARLTLTYRHRIGRPTPACVHEARYGDSYADLMERCYWDYLRIYVPLGTELIELSGSDTPAEVYEESGKTVIATAFLLGTGESRQIQLRYRPGLPVRQGTYTLLIQKQAGVDSLPCRVGVRLPDGAQPEQALPMPLAWYEGKAIWQGILRRDWDLSLRW